MPAQTGSLFRRKGGIAFRIAHGEGFCLMKYCRRDGSGIEWIWNSRDGVTPFALAHTREGLAHADFHEDTFCPNFVPPIGMRVFMSWTDAPVAFRVETKLKWDDRIKDADPESRAELRLMEPFGYRPTDPCVITVDAELRQHFALLAEHTPFIA